MMFRMESFVLILALTLTSGAARTSSANPPPIMVTDIDGQRLNLLGHDAKAAVLFFITDDCPITNSYLPEFNRIVSKYAAQEVAFYAVYTDPTVSEAAIRRHALEYGLKVPLIRDAEHSLVHRVGATITPEVAVLDRRGNLIYLGPIDDLYVDFGKRRPSPTQSFLRQALDGVLSGAPVPFPTANPIGCFISAGP
jgi:thiol-disulfide isomerase/thioredoxin